MQGGSVTRHGKGWRGRWREHGRLHSTRVVPTKGEARELLVKELDRMRRRESPYPWHQPKPITVRELADRWLAQRVAAPITIKYNEVRLQRLLAACGSARAQDITSEVLAGLLAGQRGETGANFQHDQVRTWRAMWAFGVRAGLVTVNPAREVKVRRPVRGERIIPFDSWAEVEAVAARSSHWAPLIVFMADSGARPAEALALEHRHVHGRQVELPGSKTDDAPRVVTLTERGAEAIASVPRALGLRLVFHVEGRPVSWTYFAREVWRPALAAAGLEYRAPYNLRHTFAVWSLRAGVPIATVAREMGHSSTERTFKVYSQWHRELGDTAAALRSAWASQVNPATLSPGLRQGD